MTPKYVFVAVLVFLPVPASAQTIDAAGVWTGTPGSVVHAVSDELVTVHVNVTHDRFEPASQDNPAANARGQCFGALMFRAGQPSGTGNCHYVDGDGDMLVTEWVVEGLADGWTTGRWTFIGGNGKYTGGAGTGAYRSTQDGSGGYRAELTGEMTLN